jgi:hypothetical protein
MDGLRVAVSMASWLLADSVVVAEYSYAGIHMYIIRKGGWWMDE